MTKKSLGKFRHILLYDRNVNMSNTIASIIHKKPTFFAVGAAHLAGNKGILALLKRKKINIKSV